MVAVTVFVVVSMTFIAPAAGDMQLTYSLFVLESKAKAFGAALAPSAIVVKTVLVAPFITLTVLDVWLVA
jgi:hypothetical protein